jgi:hypothetical protein
MRTKQPIKVLEGRDRVIRGILTGVCAARNGRSTHALPGWGPKDGARLQWRSYPEVPHPTHIYRCSYGD